MFIKNILFSFFIQIYTFLIFINSVISKDQISLRSGLNLSSFFMNFTGDIKFPMKTEILMKQAVNYFSEPSAELGKIYELNLPKYFDSSSELLSYQVVSIQRNNTLLNQSLDYNLSMNYPSNLVTDYPKHLNFNNELSSHYTVEVNYSAPYLQHKSFHFKDVNIDMTVSFDNLIFGLKNDKKNNLFIFEYSKNLIIKRNLDEFVKLPIEWNFTDLNFKSIHISENFEINESYLILKSNNSLYIFSLLMQNDGHEVKILIKNKISHSSLTPKIIKKVLFREDMIFIGEKNGGIQILNKDSDLIWNFYFFTYKNSSYKINILDMIIVSKSLYVLSEDFGLKILNLTDTLNITFTDFNFYHPYLRKLDLHRNPYKDFKYLGVLVSERYFDEGNEFFFELIVNDEFKPVLNRYYLEDNFMDINYFISDDKFSYLYEHYSNSIYVIIRSNIVTEYNSIYKIQIPELHNKIVSQEIFFVNNKINNQKMIGILAENELILIENILFKNGVLQLKFNQLGAYKLILNSDSDYCEGSNKTIYKNEDNVYLCSIDMNLEFNVNKESILFDNIKNRGIASYIIVFVFILILGIVLIKAYPYIINIFRKYRYSQSNDDSHIPNKPNDMQEINQIEIANTEK